MLQKKILKFQEENWLELQTLTHFIIIIAKTIIGNINNINILNILYINIYIYIL